MGGGGRARGREGICGGIMGGGVNFFVPGPKFPTKTRLGLDVGRGLATCKLDARRTLHVQLVVQLVLNCKKLRCTTFSFWAYQRGQIYYKKSLHKNALEAINCAIVAKSLCIELEKITKILQKYSFQGINL